MPVATPISGNRKFCQLARNIGNPIGARDRILGFLASIVQGCNRTLAIVLTVKAFFPDAVRFSLQPISYSYSRLHLFDTRAFYRMYERLCWSREFAGLSWDTRALSKVFLLLPSLPSRAKAVYVKAKRQGNILNPCCHRSRSLQWLQARFPQAL